MQDKGREAGPRKRDKMVNENKFLGNAHWQHGSTVLFVLNVENSRLPVTLIGFCFS